jgi:hypothetical protein
METGIIRNGSMPRIMVAVHNDDTRAIYGYLEMLSLA